MPRDIRKYLFDIFQACLELQRFTQGKTFEDYIGDSFLRSAVERQFEIIVRKLRPLNQKKQILVLFHMAWNAVKQTT